LNIGSGFVKVNARDRGIIAKSAGNSAKISKEAMMAKLARLSKTQIARQLVRVPGWRRRGNAIMKEFVLRSFTGAARFISKIAPIANAMDHHPDVELYRYKRVKIVLTTHSVGGITRNDFELAAKIDQLAPTSKSGKT
jgi:4a-hydroxytetrahydrobiopterin dehydratase